jgi:DNA-binding transcriptional MerR regulator
MTERVFAIADACAASGISRFNLHQMIHRGQFVPARGTRFGVRRGFTLRDIVHLTAIADLHAAGLSLARAVEIAGSSAEGTTGRETIIRRHGETELVLNVSNIAGRVRARLGLIHA